jgi:Tfp pilus assembly protein PilF
MALAVSLAGCGGSSGPKLSDSSKLLIEARTAIADGNPAKAMESLDASIAAQPTSWAYLERAKLNARQGSDQAAEADCKEVLKLDPENRDVPWIRGELKKPKEKRFQGQFQFPPSAKK